MTVESWEEIDGALERDFVFKDFDEAFAFMAEVAALAKEANHHPSWQNTYNKVKIRLSTHEAGAITEKDLALAESIDTVFSQFKNNA